MENSVLATYMGIIKRKRFKFDSYTGFSKHKKIIEWNKIEHERIYEVKFNTPVLNVNDQVKLENDEIVDVVRIVREVNGDFIFYTNYIIETIEDEETLKSFDEAEKQKVEWELEKLKEEKAKLISICKENDISHNSDNGKWDIKKWYQFWK